jgi:hypothetical protein
MRSIAASALGLALMLGGCGTAALGSGGQVAAPRLCRAPAQAGPSHARWSVLARSPLGPRSDPVFVWDGCGLLELGGSSRGFLRRTGAAYDPRRGRWRLVAPAPAGVVSSGVASVWTGRLLFVSGGAAGAMFDPTADRWTLTRRPPIPLLRQAAAVWDGRGVVLAGLVDRAVVAARYRPGADAWTRIDPPAPAGHPSLGLAMVTTDDGVLLWSLWGGRGHFPGTGWGVDVYRLRGAGGWVDVTGSWPQSETVDDPVFTGRQVLLAPGQIWCGACSHPPPVGSQGYLVDPRTLRRTAIPHGPLDDLGPQILWTGSREISLNAAGEITGPNVRVLPGEIAFWRPAAHRWTRGSSAPCPLSDTPAVWAGHELFVLGRDGTLLSYR